MKPHTVKAINKLWDAYHHAYDPETCRKDLSADFDRMRSLVYQAIRILETQDPAYQVKRATPAKGRRYRNENTM